MKATSIKLVEQLRIKEDQNQQFELISKMERGEQIQVEDFLIYKELSPADTDNDIDWLTASIVVTTNRERHTINHDQAIRFAKQHRTHVIRWPVEHKNWQGRPYPDTEALQDCVFWEYFVDEAPSFITDNVNKHARIANATRTQYHSLSLTKAQEQFVLNAKATQAFGTIISLEAPPLFVNVALVDEEKELKGRKRKRHPANPTIEAWKDLTLVPGRVVVPLAPVRNKSNAFEKTVVSGGITYAPSRVEIKNRFPVEPAFSITVHKAQGQTLEKLIVALSHRAATFCEMTYEGIYVSTSRIQETESMRLLLHRNQQDSLTYLTTLRPNKAIKAFFAGFAESNTEWNANLAYAYFQNHE